MSLLLSVFLIAGMCDIPTYGAGTDSAKGTGRAAGLCEHHTEHTEECGYQEEQPCTHGMADSVELSERKGDGIAWEEGFPENGHDRECYRIIEKCLHKHEASCYPAEEDDVWDMATLSEIESREPLECSHICDEACGCVTIKLDCRHEHDETCGYQEGRDCTYECPVCMMEEPEEIPVALTAVSMQRAGGAVRTEPLNVTKLSPAEYENTAEGWKWEPDVSGNGDGTLTLTDCHIETDQKGVLILPTDAAIRIVLEGENTLENTNASFMGAMITNSQNLSTNHWIIEGDGELHITSAESNAYGFTGRTVTIESGTIYSNTCFCCIFNDFTMNGGSLTVENSSTVWADAVYTDSGPVNITDGELNLTTVQAGIHVPGVRKGEQSVNISGGEVRITAGVSCIHIGNGGGTGSQSINITGGIFEGEASSSSALYAKDINIGNPNGGPAPYVIIKGEKQPAIQVRNNLTISGSAEVSAESTGSYGLYVPGELTVADSASVTATGQVDAKADSVMVDESAELNAMVRGDTVDERVWTVYGDAELHEDLSIGPEALTDSNGKKVPVKLVVTPGAVLTIPDGVTLDAANNGITFDTLKDYLSAEEGAIQTKTEDGIFLLPVQTILITVAAKPQEGGTTTGGGYYTKGEEAVVSAQAGIGYRFVRWEEKGSEASRSEEYTFIAKEDRELTAVFEKDDTPDPVKERVETPVITPGGGIFEESQHVIISCNTPGADIYYTTDGSMPGTGSIRYTGAFIITDSTVIKAVGIKEGMENSQVISISFTKNSSSDDGNHGGDGDSSDDGNHGGNGGSSDNGSSIRPSGNGSSSSGSGNSSSSLESSSSGAGTWIHDGTGWRYQYADGTWEAGRNAMDDGTLGEQISWKYIDGAWWAFDPEGYMKDGWVLDMEKNLWYWIDPESGMRKGWYQDEQDGQLYYLNGLSGHMLTGWQLIDGDWYYFNPLSTEATWFYDRESRSWKYDMTKGRRPLGAMYRSETTPDGYEVDEKGRRR